MQPVVLSVVDGKNFLLGTFDTAGFQNWWKSDTFPGEVEAIQQPLHVYGQYHICICKMSNGTYSIYRTKNSGKSWIQVYNTPNIIYTLTLIDYGWVIGSTSAGWIESWQDSGYTWNEISSFAPGCQTVINVGDDILFAHDTNFVWKSEDYARTWKVVLDVHNIRWQSFHNPNVFNTTTFSGYVPPALCGYGSRVIAGCGPYIVYSDTYGNAWTMPWSWMGDPGFAPFGLTWIRPYSNIRVLQLAVTDLIGTRPSDIIVTARVRMISQNKVRYIYCKDPEYFNTWTQLFDLNYINDFIGTINTYGVMHIGTSEAEILSTVTNVDASGNPIVKISTNGTDWTSINPQTVVVYEGDTPSDTGQQVFDEEYLATYTWSGQPCHNRGQWIIESNKVVRGLSWDQSLFLKSRSILTKSTPFLYTTLITKYETYLSDILSKKKFVKTYTCSAPFRKMMDLSYLVSLPLQTTFIEDFNMLTAMARRIPNPYDMQIYDRKSVPVYTFYDLAVIDTDQKTYKCDIRLINDHIEEIISSVEKYTPQMLDIEYLDIPYKPYDSRRDPVVP